MLALLTNSVIKAYSVEARMDQVYSIAILLVVLLDHKTICSSLRMILSKSPYLHHHLTLRIVCLAIQVEVNHYRQTILFSEAILKVDKEEI